MGTPDTSSLSQYHERQRAVVAQNEAANLSSRISAANSKLREVEELLVRALAELDGEEVSSARSEIEEALSKLRRIRS